MEGINFLTDSDNNKVAVQIDLRVHGELWQDFYDLLLVEAAKDEESDSLETYLEKFEKRA